ncbi:MAG: GNAT family N-acetyltransferase [Cyclobacteriaceae bacterium]
MLVKLYDLPPRSSLSLQTENLAEKGIFIRTALAPEKHIVVKWVQDNFNAHWASEVEKAYANTPITCKIAESKGELLGFACYEATCKAFFGPTGVLESKRGQGIGKLLLLEALWGLRDLGYAYGIIGAIGPAEFYAKQVGATLIEQSTPGIYKGMLR